MAPRLIGIFLMMACVYSSISHAQEAPASSGMLYVVNGQTTSLRFEILDNSYGATPTLITLPGQKGQNFRCIRGCEVKIKTGDSVISRTLQPGRSYIIAFDTIHKVYDFRVYSQ
jgi:hypothetical protein